MIKIPFCLIPPQLLKKISYFFQGAAKSINPFFPYLEIELERADMKINPRDYIAMCLASTSFFFIFFSLFLILLLSKKGYFLIGPLIVFIVGVFMLIQQLNYPKLSSRKKIKKIEVNIVSALRAILIQVNSGITLFDVMVIISSQNYGEVSLEFKKAVKEINAGIPQIEALENMATKNPSLFFRRAIWQLINGMKAGSDIGNVIKEITDSLSKEQIIQVEKYGSQLNPIAMFYMLVAVIIPALGTTFLIVLLSFVSLSETGTKIVFWSLYGLVVFFQIMFLGIIKTKRPNLLGE
ncbi:MAG: type II secretion system F family protein [Nanoarchaeota archaeon]|nr:type II secretion system F family protein [Nanoarchaeota archaeon]